MADKPANLLRAIALPAHFSDRRGDLHWCVITEPGEFCGSFAEIVWREESLETVEDMAGALFVTTGHIFASGADARPNAFAVHRIDHRLTGGPRDVAATLRDIADWIDPPAPEGD